MIGCWHNDKVEHRKLLSHHDVNDEDDNVNDDVNNDDDDINKMLN